MARLSRICCFLGALARGIVTRYRQLSNLRSLELPPTNDHQATSLGSAVPNRDCQPRPSACPSTIRHVSRDAARALALSPRLDFLNEKNNCLHLELCLIQPLHRAGILDAMIEHLF
jgi:hypothetical protein